MGLLADLGNEPRRLDVNDRSVRYCEIAFAINYTTLLWWRMNGYRYGRNEMFFIKQFTTFDCLAVSNN